MQAIKSVIVVILLCIVFFWVAIMLHLCFHVGVVPVMRDVLVMHVGVLLVMERLVVGMLGIWLILANFVVLGHWCSVLMVRVLGVVLRVAMCLVFDCLVVVSRVVSLTIAMLEVLTLDVCVLGIWVLVQGVVSVTDRLEIVLRVVVRIASLLSVCVMTDQRSVVLVNIDIGVVSDCCDVMSDGGVNHSLSVVDNWCCMNKSLCVVKNWCFVNYRNCVDNRCCVNNSLSMVSNWCVMDGLGVMRDSLHLGVLLCLVGRLGLVVSLNVVRVLVLGLLRVDKLMVRRESASVAIVVVHLQDQVTILNINLARHEQGGVVLKSPVVARVPFFRVKCVEVVSPSQSEIFFILIVVIDLDEVVLGVPWHLSVVEIVIPRFPAGRPEVHHELRGHLQEVHILCALALAHELVVDVPADVVRGPLDRVGEPIAARVEASRVVMILLAVLPDNVHGEGVLSDGGHDLHIDLVPAVGPVLCGIGEERLNSTHLHGVLHLGNEFTVLEPLLRADLTGKVVGLSKAREGNDSDGQLLHLVLIC